MQIYNTLNHSAPFVRMSDLCSSPKSGKVGLLPMCRATILNKVKAGTFPKPIKLSSQITAWKVADIQNYIDSCPC